MTISKGIYRFFQNESMRKKSGLILTVIVLFFVLSCSKDNNSSGSSALAGTWVFNGLHAKTSSTVSDTQGGIQYTTVSTSDYTTTSNGGTVKISGNTMTGTGITYSATINVLATDYVGTTILDTFSTTIPFNVPPTNSVSSFEVIGKDSIHYTSAAIFGAAGSGAPAVTGSKFSIDGDVLTLTSNVVQDKVFDSLGVVITQHDAAFVVTTLQKQ